MLLRLRFVLRVCLFTCCFILLNVTSVSSSQVKVCHLVRGKVRSSSSYAAESRLFSVGLCLVCVSKMKRRQKRVLQMAFLFMVALIFLPNVGLWSMYREKTLMKSHESGEQVSKHLKHVCDFGFYELAMSMRSHACSLSHLYWRINLDFIVYTNLISE